MESKNTVEIEKEIKIMLSIRITLSNETRKDLSEIYERAKIKGDLSTVKRIMAVIAFFDGESVSSICAVLMVSDESIRLWVKKLMIYGPKGLISKKIPGRKPRLTKTQRKELDRIISDGPNAAGFSGACWRSPMIQTLIYSRYGVFYSVHYISELLKNMGFSFQKARFVPEKQDIEKRKEWLETVWPLILKTAEKKKAYILFGDEASFPQWGTLSYTWAKKGCQPVVKTSGIRKSYKVFGLIDYFSGLFFCKGHEKRLNSESYSDFLMGVIKKTRKHLILIHDNAPYHSSRAMREFYEKHSDRLTVFNLPSYSPDYNPIEMLWKKIKEKETHLHYFPTFDSLKNKVNEALLNFKNLKHEILSLFVFYNGLSKSNC